MIISFTDHKTNINQNIYMNRFSHKYKLKKG